MLEAIAEPLPAEEVSKLVYLYAEKESPKYERTAMKWLRRYLNEKEPALKEFATLVRSLDERQLNETLGSA